MNYIYKYIKYKNKYLQLKYDNNKYDNIKYIGGSNNKQFIKNTIFEKYTCLENKYKTCNNIINLFFASISYCSSICSKKFNNNYLKNIFNKKIKKILKYNFALEDASTYLIEIINKYNINIDNISLIISSSFMLEAILYLYEFKKYNTNYDNIYTYIINKSTQSKEYTDILNNIVQSKNIKNSKYELKNFIKSKDNIMKDTIIIDYNNMDNNTNISNILLLLHNSLKQLNKNGDIVIYIRIINSRYYYDIFNYIGTFFNNINIEFNKFSFTFYFSIIYKNYKGISTKQYTELDDIIKGEKKVPITNEVEFNKFKNAILLREKEVSNNFNIIEHILKNNDMNMLQDYFLINFTRKLKYYKSLNLEIVDWLDNDNIPISYYNNKINDIYKDTNSIIINYKTNNSKTKINNLLENMIKYNHSIYEYNYNADEMILLDTIIKEQNKLFKLINKKNVNNSWCVLIEIFIELKFFDNINNINIMFINENIGNSIDSCIYFLKNKFNWISILLDSEIIINKSKNNFDKVKNNIFGIDNIIYYKNKYKDINVIIDIKDNINVINILSALYILSKGGNVIFKVNHINTDSSYISLLSIFNKLFKKVIFYKSNLDLWDENLYLIGISYKGYDSNLLDLIKGYNKGKQIKIQNNNFLKTYYDISIQISSYYQKNMIFIYFLIHNESIYKGFKKEIFDSIKKFNINWIKKYIK